MFNTIKVKNNFYERGEMMRRILERPISKGICLYLVFVFSGMFALPLTAQAAFLPSSDNILNEMEVTSLDEVRAALEDDLLAERLTSLGLSSEEIRARIDSLSVEERQAVMAHMEEIQAGGSDILTLALVVLIAVVIYLLLKKDQQSN